MQHDHYHSSGSNSNSGGAEPSAAATSSEHLSPLSQLGFLGKLTAEKKQTKDGQPPKRRGPKPDSKPALTRRQELNRQAQRTHRERKEQYIKALEQEVMRLKEIYSTASRERDQVLQENRRLKELLAAHGITYDFGAPTLQFKHDNTTNHSGFAGYGASSSGSFSGSYAGTSDRPTYSPPIYGGNRSAPLSVSPPMSATSQRSLSQMPDNTLDYDQLGIDFVLTYDSQGRPVRTPLGRGPYPSPPPHAILERPCMDHIQFLLVRSHNNEDEPMMPQPMEDVEHKDCDNHQEIISGHALMATAPPQSHIMSKPEEKYPHQLPADLSTDTLAKLLDLSNRLPFDRSTEITPVMAWTMIYRHERLSELTPADIEQVKNELAQKVRCYGFGAVVEEFELRDALENVFSRKDPVSARPSISAPGAVPIPQPKMATQQIQAF